MRGTSKRTSSGAISADSRPARLRLPRHDRAAGNRR
jgi:hypothetical protein